MLPNELAVQHQRLQECIERYELQRIQSEILEVAVPCITLFKKQGFSTLGEISELIKDYRPKEMLISKSDPLWLWDQYQFDHLSLGESRIGGLPDLPHEIAWPKVDKKKLPFVAQIDFSALPQYEGSLFPHVGWLYVFTGGDAFPQDVCTIYFNGPREQLQRISQPPEEEMLLDWAGEGYYSLVPIGNAELGVSVAFDDEATETLNLSYEEEEDLGDLSTTMSLCNKSEVCAQMGGHLNYHDVSPTETRNIGGSEGDWTLLMEIGSVGSMQWSDCGLLGIFARRAQLEKLDLSAPCAMIYSS